jgi:hypothetical protein
MAAKEEAAILKYLKKNPSQEALDISFGTDIDEDVVKQALAVLQGKGEVESKDVGGRPQWSIAAPKPKAAPAPAAPKAEGEAPAAAPKAPKAERPAVEDADDEDAAPKAGGVSKGFVFSVSSVVLVLAVAIGYVLGGMQASSSAKALADTEIKNVRDSLGCVKLSLNTRLDNLESQIRDLKAAAVKAEEPAEKKEDAKAKKAPAKPAKKKRR